MRGVTSMKLPDGTEYKCVQCGNPDLYDWLYCKTCRKKLDESER